MDLITSEELIVPSNAFFQALYIYLKKQQVVNRKLSSVTNVLCKKVNSVNSSVLCGASADEIINLFETEGDCFDLESIQELNVNEDFCVLIVDKLIPRNLEVFPKLQVATIIDCKNCCATFSPLEETKNLVPNFTYKVSYVNQKLSIFAQKSSSEENKLWNWLKYVLVKKLSNWMTNCENSTEAITGSLQLIDPEEYNNVYKDLKDKYGRDMVKIWPECTDPLKYIYEDCGIAAYLLMLWKQERLQKQTEKLQSFVDLGCGNGLLVYILAQEGHPGFGVDLRKRDVWSIYPANVILKEYAIVPSDESLFPETDWIIGNHSDELSPWISVISARSSYNSNYFLLPCCCYEFNGAKYQRKNGKKSQYHDYIDFLLEISEKCEFKTTEIDRLKIPSTKRICLIGSGRKYDEKDFSLKSEGIQKYINENLNKKTDSEQWSEDFKPRDKVEVVKNCTKIDVSISEKIVESIVSHLLAKKSFSPLFQDWNCGGSVTMPEAVNLVSSENLKKLKSECGGLQTLLKNNHQIFLVANGVVKIRVPQKLSERVFSDRTSKRNVVKSKPCYFLSNHPSGCPLSDTECPYLHQ
ncbi:unnamed protein product [Diamesa serratosioi]